MKTKTSFQLGLHKVNAKLRQWQERHGTLEKVAAAHRRVVVDRAFQSMAFENEPVSMARLKVLLENRKGKRNG